MPTYKELEAAQKFFDNDCTRCTCEFQDLDIPWGCDFTICKNCGLPIKKNTECERCQGHGWVLAFNQVHDSDTCPDCDGKGIEETE